MRVLVVDDDIAITEVLKSNIDCKKLRLKECLTANNVRQAKEIIEREKVDIIISDIEMPQESGIDLLRWYREQRYEGEFIFLTNFERFDYAKDALSLGAAEYLLKPVDIQVLEAALQKIIRKLKEIKRANDLNGEQLFRRYLVLLLEDPYDSERAEIESALGGKPFSDTDEYTLVVSKITSLEKDKQKIHASLLKFMMTNVHAEVMLGNPEDQYVACIDNRSHYMFVMLCKGSETEILDRAKLLVGYFPSIFTASITCMVCKPCRSQDFYQTVQRASYIIADYVLGYGRAFAESEVCYVNIEKAQVLDMSLLEEYLENKEKIKYMVCLRGKLNERKQNNSLNAHTMATITQEVMQTVYSYLAKKGISAAELFNDHELRTLSINASQSLTDIIKWVNYLLDIAFACEVSAKETLQLHDRINQYIADHYSEDISRNEIAAEFFLNPEYLAKVYKKATGVSIKEYLNEYRIRQAKRLLENENLRISDVAEMVGFNNMTYFSTCFKKYTGESPNKYRK